nr:uncharacterized protein LOC109184720 [Ipomoea batatas]
MRIQEATDSHGRKKTVVLSVKGDVHVDEDIIRREKEFNVGTSEVGSGDLEAGQHSSSGDVAKLEKVFLTVRLTVRGPPTFAPGGTGAGPTENSHLWELNPISPEIPPQKESSLSLLSGS